MSARDAESGSAGYRGGSGRAGGLGNGGLGGGMGGGFGGGGAARMGGAGNQTGLGTGTTMYGNSAFGRAGGMAAGYGMMGRGGALGNLRNLDGSAMVPRAPARPAGLLGGATPQPMPAMPYEPITSVPLPPINPLIDVQPGLPPLSGVPVPGMPGVNMRLGRALMGGGYNPWSGNSAYPPGFGTQTAPGKTDFGDPQRVAPGKGDFQGSFNGSRGFY